MLQILSPLIQKKNSSLHHQKYFSFYLIQQVFRETLIVKFVTCAHSSCQLTNTSHALGCNTIDATTNHWLPIRRTWGKLVLSYVSLLGIHFSLTTKCWPLRMKTSYKTISISFWMKFVSETAVENNHTCNSDFHCHPSSKGLHTRRNLVPVPGTGTKNSQINGNIWHF